MGDKTVLLKAGPTDRRLDADGTPMGAYVVGRGPNLDAGASAGTYEQIETFACGNYAMISWETNDQGQPISARVTLGVDNKVWFANAEIGSVTIKVVSFGPVGQKIIGTFNAQVVPRSAYTAPGSKAANGAPLSSDPVKVAGTFSVKRFADVDRKVSANF
jgi:hypothetical protein